MREPSPQTDFVVPVDGIGTFTFKKKSLRDQVACEVEYARLTEGVPFITNFLGNLSSAMSDLKILTVSAPEGWETDLDALDPEDDDTFIRLMKVWSALRDKQRDFRKKPKGDGAGAGEGK